MSADRGAAAHDGVADLSTAAHLQDQRNMSGFISSPYLIPTQAQAPPAITFTGAGAVDEGIGGLNLPLPAGFQADDIHLMVLESDGGENYAAPTGWTIVTGFPASSTGTGGADTQLTVMWRRAVGGDTTVALADVGDHNIGRIIGFRGVRTTGDPWNVIQGPTVQNTASTALTIAGPTTTVNNCMCVVIASGTGPGADSTTEYSAFANASLDSIIEAIDNTT